MPQFYEHISPQNPEFITSVTSERPVNKCDICRHDSANKPTIHRSLTITITMKNSGNE